MRAAILYGKEDIRVEDVAEVPLKAGEVRVRIEAALTCGTDLKVYKRGYHAKMIVPPAVFGHELAGAISEIHPETRGWSIGERVVAANSAPCGQCYYCDHGRENLCDDLLFLNGAYAESIVIPGRVVEKNLLRLKAATSFADAALTEPFACVVQSVSDLGLRGNEHVLVLGSGPIGLMFTRLATHLGCKVTLAGRGETRLAIAKKLGAAVIEVHPEAELASVVRDASTSAYGVVFEAIGKPEAWEAAVQLVRKGGKVNFFGGCPAGTSVRFDTGLIHYSNLTLLASFHHTPQTIRKALELIEAGVIQARDFINNQSTLNALPELFKSMAAGNRAVKTLVKIRE